jgi:hypothetical protein
MQEITVDVFESEIDEWWWEARQLRLRRGPFADQAEVDSDAVEHAEALISALCAHGLRRG